MDLDRRLYRAGEVRRLEARHDDDNLTRSRDAGAGFRLRRFDRRLPESVISVTGRLLVSTMGASLAFRRHRC
jgi:hypothetical protein